MRTAQELAAMTYSDVHTAWNRWEISLVERQAWILAFDPPRRRKGFLPQSIKMAHEIKALLPA